MDIGIVLWLSVLVHGLGDFVAQPEWMALRKPSSWPVALSHVAVYTALFGLITLSPVALGIIGGSHLLIDRFSLAKLLIRMRNQVAPRRWRPAWKDTADTGFVTGTPSAIAAVLVTVVDQIMHLSINSAVLLLL